MSRGNSKLYRINVDSIKMLCDFNSREIEKAFLSGYTFVSDGNHTKVYIISTTCNKKSIKIELINADIVDKYGVIKEIRI